MQSIWKISLGTWLVLLGDYPSITHPLPISLFYRPKGRTELNWEGLMRRTSSLAGFTLLHWGRVNVSFKWCTISDCPPRHVADRDWLGSSSSFWGGKGSSPSKLQQVTKMQGKSVPCKKHPVPFTVGSFYPSDFNPFCFSFVLMSAWWAGSFRFVLTIFQPSFITVS